MVICVKCKLLFLWKFVLKNYGVFLAASFTNFVVIVPNKPHCILHLLSKHLRTSESRFLFNGLLKLEMYSDIFRYDFLFHVPEMCDNIGIIRNKAEETTPLYIF